MSILVVLRLDSRTARPGLVFDLEEVISMHPGNQAIACRVETSRGVMWLRLGETVDAFDGALVAELEELLGCPVHITTDGADAGEF